METLYRGNGGAPIVKELRVVSERKEVDYGAAAKGILSQAEVLFEKKREKEAYIAILQALRFYLTKKYTLGREMIDDSRLLSLLSQRGLDVRAVESVLRLTSLLDFPEYQPNRNDFEQIMQSARMAIR